jgi:hypothetical protein
LWEKGLGDEGKRFVVNQHLLEHPVLYESTYFEVAPET